MYVCLTLWIWNSYCWNSLNSLINRDIGSQFQKTDWNCCFYNTKNLNLHINCLILIKRSPANILNRWIQENLQSHRIKIQNLHTHMNIFEMYMLTKLKREKRRVLLELQSYKTSSTLSIKLFYTLLSLCGVCIASLL
jgi:hypothetical protein